MPSYAPRRIRFRADWVRPVPMLLLALLAAPLGAAPKPGQAAPARKDLIEKQLADAWDSFYAGKYPAAIKLATPVAKVTAEAPRVEAQYCCARAYWALKSPRGRSFAKKAWAKLKSASSLNAHLARVQIAQALQLEDNRKRDQAVSILKIIVDGGARQTSTAEAAIELARLYADAGQWDDAERTYLFAEKLLTHKSIELSATVVGPFLRAARAGRANLKYLREAGRKLFEKAEALRQDKKYRDAAKTYRECIRTYPKSDYAPRSTVQIGHCFVGIRKYGEAEQHWRKFLAADPKGPWRGQAHLGLIDLYLEVLFDLRGGTEKLRAAQEALPAGLADESGRKSWRLAAPELHLRAGIIAYVTGDYASAATAFIRAADRTPLVPETVGARVPGARRPHHEKAKPRNLLPRIARIAAAAEAQIPLLPDDVRAKNPANKPSLALSLACIYLAADDQPRTGRLLGWVLPGRAAPNTKDPAQSNKLRPATGAQLAFSVYLRAELDLRGGRIQKARAAYVALLAKLPEATWMDATTYSLAVLIERNAWAESRRAIAQAVREAPAPKTPPKGRPKNPRPQSPRDKRLADEQAKKRFNEYVRARSVALPHWQNLVKGFPNSRYIEPARYHIAVLLYHLDQFKAAADALGSFVDSHPRSPFAGRASVRLTDIALERLFSLPLARDAAVKGVAWAQGTTAKLSPPPKKSTKTRRTRRGRKAEAEPSKPASPKVNPNVYPLWAPAIVYPDEKALAFTVYESYLRAGLVAYLDQQYEQAVKLFRAAGPKEPPTKLARNDNLHEAGMYFMVKAASQKKSVTEPEGLAEAKTDAQRVAIQLADLYLEAIRPEKAEQILLRVVTGDPVFGKRTEGLEAYAIIQLSTALDRQPEKRSQALTWLGKLRDARYKGTHWGGYGLFRLAVFTYNQTQSAQQSMPLYKQMYTGYPNHPKAELAHYYYCLDAVQIGQHAEAKAAAQEFLKKYPHSKWKKSVQGIAAKEPAT